MSQIMSGRVQPTGQQSTKRTTGGFDIETALKPLTNLMKSSAKMSQDKIKLQSEMQMAQLKEKMGFMYKMAEKEHVGPYQRQLQEQYQQQGGAPTGDPFAPTSQQRTEVVPGKTGYETKRLSYKDAIYKNILKKPEESRSENENKFVDNYLGMAQKGISATQQRKEQLQNNEVLAILKRGTWFSEEQGGQVQFKDRDEAIDFIMDNYDVDVTDPTIQEALAEYKPAEEEITPGAPASRGFLGMGARKATLPTKEKYGYQYEQREDGKWYKVGEAANQNVFKRGPQYELRMDLDENGNPIRQR